MKQKIISLCIATFMTIARSYGGVILTVPDVNITQGSTSYVVIYYDLGKTSYTAYQLDIAYPEGISSVCSDDGTPEFIKSDVYGETHSVSSIYTTKNQDRFQCFSVNSVSFSAQSGTLLTLPIKAQKTMAEGTYKAVISPIEFVQTDATPDRPDAITFNIVVSKCVVLDERSTMKPVEVFGVDAIVKRTIKQDVWSTICLPFDMSESQVKDAFGDDVKLAKFTSWSSDEDDMGNIVGLTIGFTSTANLEANTPCLIKVSTTVNQFNVQNIEIHPEEKPVVQVGTKKSERGYLIGTYVANTEVPSKTLFLSDNQFWYSTGQTRMNGFRAYFDLFDVLSEVDEGYNAKIHFYFDDEEATDISELCDTSLKGNVYTLQGNLLGKNMDSKTLPQGIYIINQKKYIKK